MGTHDKQTKFTIINLSCTICGKYVAPGTATFVGDKRMHATCKKQIVKYLPALDLTLRARSMVSKFNDKAENIRRKWAK